MDLASSEDREMGEAADQVFREIDIAAGIFHAGYDAGITFVQPANHLGRDRHAANIREMIEIEPKIGAGDSIDHGRIEPERAVFGDAAAKHARWHEQHAMHLLVKRVSRQAHNIWNRQGADRDDNAGGIDTTADQSFQCGDAIFRRKFRAFAGSAEQGDPIASLRHQPFRALDETRNVRMPIGRDGSRNRNSEAIGLGQASHINLI